LEIAQNNLKIQELDFLIVSFYKAQNVVALIALDLEPRKLLGARLIGDSLGGDILTSLSARNIASSAYSEHYMPQTLVFARRFLPQLQILVRLSSPFRLNASAGVGLHVPVVAGAALEANYALLAL
jgi:hypothetical protein